MLTGRARVITTKIADAGWDDNFLEALDIALMFDSSHYVTDFENVTLEILLDQDVNWVREQVFDHAGAYWDFRDFQILKALEPLFINCNWSAAQSKLPPLIIDQANNSLIDGFHRAFLLCLRTEAPCWNVIDIANQPHFKAELDKRDHNRPSTTEAA